MTAARREETEMSDRGLLTHVNMVNLRGDEKGVSPDQGSLSSPPGKSMVFNLYGPPNICLLETSLIFL